MALSPWTSWQLDSKLKTWTWEADLMVGDLMVLKQALRSGYDPIVAYTYKKFSKNTLKVYFKKQNRILYLHEVGYVLVSGSASLFINTHQWESHKTANSRMAHRELLTGSQGLIVHSCHPSSSRDWEGKVTSSSPAWISSWETISTYKRISTYKGGGTIAHWWSTTYHIQCSGVHLVPKHNQLIGLSSLYFIYVFIYWAFIMLLYISDTRSRLLWLPSIPNTYC